MVTVWASYLDDEKKSILLLVVKNIFGGHVSTKTIDASTGATSQASLFTFKYKYWQHFHD